jgi:hypothetical protein
MVKDSAVRLDLAFINPRGSRGVKKTWENQGIRWLIIVFHSYSVAIFPMKKA